MFLTFQGAKRLQALSNSSLFVPRRYVNVTSGTANVPLPVVKDISKLVKPGLGLLAVATLASVLSDFALLWLAFIIVFTVPKGYSMKKDQIDGL